MGWKEELEAFKIQSAELVRRTRLTVRGSSASPSEEPAAANEPSAPLEAAPVYDPLDATSADELAVFQALMAINMVSPGPPSQQRQPVELPSPREAAPSPCGAAEPKEEQPRSVTAPPPTREKTERELIASRVARFKAQQERLRREREEYYIRTLSRARNGER